METSALTRIPNTLKFALGSLAGLTIFIIIAMFLGDIEDRSGKIVSTVIYFASFVGLTMLYMRLGSRDKEFPMYIAFFGNLTLLSFGMITTWISQIPEDDYYSFISPASESMAMLIPMGLLIQAMTFGSYGLVAATRNNSELPRKLAVVSSWISGAVVLAVVSEAATRMSFDISGTDVYWRFVIAGVLLVALGVSSLFLLSWYEKVADPEIVAAKAAEKADEAQRRQDAYLRSTLPQATSQPPVLANETTAQWPVDRYSRPVPANADGTPDIRYAWDFNLQQPLVETLRNKAETPQPDHSEVSNASTTVVDEENSVGDK